MSDGRWNDDVAYSFSIHRTCLQVYGMWPLQTPTIFSRIRWGFFLIAQLMIIPFAMLDLIESSEYAGGSIESLLYCVVSLVGTVKCTCIGLSQKKLRVNINAAIDDWLAAKNDKNTWMIMRKYAVRTRLLTLTLLYSALMCFSSYMSVIVFINLKQLFFTDPNSMDANVTNWILLIPSGRLASSATGLQYIIILTVQIVQLISICSTNSILDTFFFNVTMYLTSQLKVLKNKFQIFANELDTEANYRKKFVDLINRHSMLMEYFQNLEDTFHLLILTQLVEATFMIALIGIRILVCLNENNYMEVTKSALVGTYLLMQSLMYTFSGDFMQAESEGIFHAMYMTSWFTLPLTLMKDLHFTMMRTSIPFRLTGGKFFYVNRETMMYILKTAASYISVLRIALFRE